MSEELGNVTSCDSCNELLTSKKEWNKSEPERLFPEGYYKDNRLLSAKFKSAVLALVAVLLVISFIVTIRYTVDEVNHRSVDSRFSDPNFNSISDRQGRIDAYSMRVEIRVLAADLLHGKVNCHVSFFPSRELVLTRGHLEIPILVYLGFYQRVYDVNSTMSPVEITFPILSGSTSYYPFDVFHTEMAVEMTDLKTMSFIPVHVILQARIPSLQFQIDQTKEHINGDRETTQLNEFDPTPSFSDDSITNYHFRLIISRPSTVIFFSTFVIVIMWCLSLSIMAVTFNIIYLTPHRPDATFLGVGSSLLFALPNLRGSQPGVPPIGIIIDAVGFFWNMALIAMSSVTILVIWTRRRDATRVLY